MIFNAIQDLRYGLRALSKDAVFSLTIVATLALGIGATTAVFSVVYGIVLQPLPYPDPASSSRRNPCSTRGHHWYHLFAFVRPPLARPALWNCIDGSVQLRLHLSRALYRCAYGLIHSRKAGFQGRSDDRPASRLSRYRPHDMRLCNSQLLHAPHGSDV